MLTSISILNKNGELSEFRIMKKDDRWELERQSPSMRTWRTVASVYEDLVESEIEALKELFECAYGWA